MAVATGRSYVVAPWSKRHDWSSGRIRDQSNTFIVVSILFSVIFNAVAWLAISSAWEDRAGEPALLAFGGVLGVIGLAILAWTVRQILVRCKFGRSILELETIPGAIGGWLAGTICVPVPLSAKRGLRLELECIARTKRRDIHRKTHIHEETLLELKQVLGRALPLRGARTYIPVAFAIPADARPSSREGRDEIVWRLRARAAQEGADYDATFIVPVFHVSDAPATEPRAESIAAGLRRSAERFERRGEMSE